MFVKSTWIESHTSTVKVLSGRTAFSYRNSEIEGIRTAVRALTVVLVKAFNVNIQFVLELFHEFRIRRCQIVHCVLREL